jgi:hypothetical protein
LKKKHFLIFDFRFLICDWRRTKTFYLKPQNLKSEISNQKSQIKN